MGKRKKPIMKFTEKSLQKALKYWKKKLFLTDWTITASIVPPDVIEGLAGSNTFEFVNKASRIRIARCEDSERDSFITKICEEQTLVHELLHLKYNFIEGTGSYEQIYVDTIEHQKLEELSKTLIMVKYNLPFDWFSNKGSDSDEPSNLSK